MANDTIVTDKEIEVHDPRLYARRAVLHGVAGGFDAVTDAHVSQYRELGFLSIEDDLLPCGGDTDQPVRGEGRGHA